MTCHVVRRAGAAVVVFVLLGAITMQPRHSGANAASLHGPAPARTCKTVKKHGKKTKVCKTVNENSQATSLAAALAHGGSDTARYAALLQIMKALRITVFNANSGKSIVAGSSKMPAGSEVPDVLLKTLAGQYGSHEGVSLDGLGVEVSALIVKNTLAPLTGTQTWGILQEAVKEAKAAPTAGYSLDPLLLYHLGLDDPTPIDLSSTAPAGSVQLDAVQSFLILYDLAVGLPQPTSARRANFVAADSGPCTWHGKTTNQPAKVGGSFLKAARTWVQNNPIWPSNDGIDPSDAAVIDVLSGLSGGIKSIQNAINIVAMFIIEHGLQVDTTPDTATTSRTHYGPPHATSNGDAAGKVLTFKIRVSMKDEFPDALRNCVSRVMTIPRQGVLANIPVKWSSVAYGTDDMGNGTVIGMDKYGTSTSDAQTNAGGEASFTFTPNTEVFPGMGKEVESPPGELYAQPQVESIFGPGVAKVIEYTLSGLHRTTFPWVVSYHQPRGFQFSGLSSQVHTTLGVDTTDTVTLQGHYCGSDPYGGDWQITQNTVIVSGGKTETGGGTFAWNFKTDTTAPLYGYFLELVPGPNPQMKMTTKAAPNIAPAVQTTMGPITEDKDCPDNSATSP